MPRRSTEWSTASSWTSVAAREQQERRPKHLPLHAHQMGAHLFGQREVGGHDAPDLVGDRVETRSHGRLDVVQRSGNVGAGAT
jgi:hypothetical protein